MSNKSEILTKLDDHQLLDVALNYQSYGYTDEVREEAFRLLEERGISSEELKRKTDYEREGPGQFQGAYESYVRHSNFALAFYFGVFILLPLNVIPETQHVITYLAFGLVILLFVYFFFRANSDMEDFLEESRGGEAIERERDNSTLMYFSLAAYAFILLSQRRRMREIMKWNSR